VASLRDARFEDLGSRKAEGCAGEAAQAEWSLRDTEFKSEARVASLRDATLE
jgi:hypothetical protein